MVKFIFRIIVTLMNALVFKIFKVLVKYAMRK